jgi:hypothetical protein
VSASPKSGSLSTRIIFGSPWVCLSLSSHKADSVAKIQVQDLIAEKLQGDSLYWAQGLIG